MTNDDAVLPDDMLDADELDADELGAGGGADQCGPAASGILHCLKMLAEEATALHLPRTLDALQRAMAACAAEAANPLAMLMEMERPAGARLH
jgi:hypothetical protein